MKYLLCLCMLLISVLTFAQPEAAEEPILQVAEQMPMFPGCQDSTGTYAELKNCADKKMLQYIYQNINYPERDRLAGNEGTVVIRFAVEKDGTISNSEILRDPGDQLGEEALRVVNLMNVLPDRWTPGKNNGEFVRTYVTLPVRFKIEEYVEPDFMMAGRDTVWTKFDNTVAYKGGDKALFEFIEDKIVFPAEGQDSCRIGIVELNTLVNQDASVNILDVVDYSSLGLDYQFEAIKAVNATTGNWEPATLGDRKVNALKSIRILLKPNMVSCSSTISEFTQADAMVDEATLLLDDANNLEAGIEKLSAALKLFPENAEYLSLRGQAYLKLDRKAEACADLSKAKETLITTWYDNLLPILCAEVKAEK